MTTISKVRYSRRSILKSGGAAVAAAALGSNGMGTRD